MIFGVCCGLLLHVGDLPGGGVHRGERLRAALRRELDEELGLDLAGLPAPRPTVVVEVLELIHRLEVYFSVSLPQRLRIKGREEFARTVEYVPLGEVNDRLPYPYFPPLSSAEEVLAGPGRFFSARVPFDPGRTIDVRLGDETRMMPLVQYVREFVVPKQAGIQVEIEWCPGGRAGGGGPGRPGAGGLIWPAALNTPLMEQLRQRLAAAGMAGPERLKWPEAPGGQEGAAPRLLAICERIDARGQEHRYRLLFQPGAPAGPAQEGGGHLRWLEQGGG